MKSTVEKLSPTRVRINVEVPFTELQPDFDARLQAAGQAGPAAWVPARTGARQAARGPPWAAVQCCEQVVNDVLPGRYSEAVTTTELRPLGEPDIEVTKIEDGDELVFTAEVDVRPDIDLPDLGALRISVDPVEVTEPTWRPNSTRCGRVSAPSPASSGRRRTAISCLSTSWRPSTGSRSRRPPPRVSTRWAPAG